MGTRRTMAPPMTDSDEGRFGKSGGSFFGVIVVVENPHCWHHYFCCFRTVDKEFFNRWDWWNEAERWFSKWCVYVALTEIVIRMIRRSKSKNDNSRVVTSIIHSYISFRSRGGVNWCKKVGHSRKRCVIVPAPPPRIMEIISCVPWVPVVWVGNIVK